jgi:WD40 repeat protein
LATGNEDQKVRLWDGAKGKHFGDLEGHFKPVQAVAWSFDSHHLASASEDRTVRVWWLGDQ